MKEKFSNIRTKLSELGSKKQVLVSLFGVLFSITAVIGITYSAWTNTSTTGNNSITTGTISMKYVEDMSFATINNATPMSANTAYQSNNYFPFQVIGEAGAALSLDYEVTITTQSGTTYGSGTDQKIRLGLKKDNTIVTDAGFNAEGSSSHVNYTNGVIIASLPTTGTGLSNNPQTIYKGTMNLDGTGEVVHNFKLYLWVDSNATLSDGDESYAITINVNTGDDDPSYAKYTLTYNNQGGRGCTNKQARQNSAWGELCVPTENTYRFEGWYTATSGGEEVTASTIATSNRTVYARWAQPVLSGSRSDTEMLGHTLTKSDVEVINIVNEINIPNGAENWNGSSDGSVKVWMVDDNSNGKYELYIGTNGDTIYTGSNAGFLFYSFSNVTQINGLNMLNTSVTTTMTSMFSNCSRLTSIDLSSFDTSSVSDFSHMFSGCSSLTSLDLSGFNTSGVNDMSLMFGGCSSLTSLDLSGFTTGSVTKMQMMFRNCSSLTSLDLSGFSSTALGNVTSMFQGCSGLTNIYFGNFGIGSSTSLADMFSGCSSLTNLDLSSFNTSSVTTTTTMFNGCTNLRTIYVDSTKWNMSSVTSSNNMFNGCSSIVGGYGTTYSSSNKTAAYAHADVAGNPGYLTEKSN